MTIKKRGLGRGLEALLANVSAKEAITRPQTSPLNSPHKNRHPSPDDINSDELIAEPVVVQKIAENNAEIAPRLPEVPIINKAIDEREAMASALIEIIQQENRHLLQETEDLRKLIDEFEAMVRHL
ncbi:hypothetical protein [Methylobacter sp. S3L5C]|uniref:hypothetical protein n=1 Tax=Methylobacter sp. S3L5C TaxID=2839024 RepID=UPI001FAE1247|nr:hypothetical protein [Methylobacter sp. S3L5C]UOA09908.1 hypothetical protein KKZ03_06535 [Methylobacter sp. S3L5C]